MMFRNKRKWMPGHTPMNTIELTETEEYKRIRARMESEKKTKKSVKFETFIKEEYREPSNKTKYLFKKYGLGEPSPVEKSYCVRVFDKGHLIDEVKFSNAIDAQNYIQKTEQFYSNLI